MAGFIERTSKLDAKFSTQLHKAKKHVTNNTAQTQESCD